MINNIPRYCLWLVDIRPDELNSLKEIKHRVEEVYKNRISSNREATKKLALFPARFGEVRQPVTNYIALPRVSSENRVYIPITILNKDIVAGDKVYTIQSSDLYVFGVLLSLIHMVWMKTTSGRLKSDYSYSVQLTYNNFPWPEVNDKDKKKIEDLAQAVLDARLEFPESSLADLYDPRTMPPALVRAHTDLDRAVDKLYRASGFKNDSERVQWLLGMWEKLTHHAN